MSAPDPQPLVIVLDLRQMCSASDILVVRKGDMAGYLARYCFGNVTFLEGRLRRLRFWDGFRE